ncbi:MAG TPA: saccharopine dehydrogenase NADP-binding domain-containing protein, partial [Kofleriaceae bacterium]|nr:saccharopine dehydrogenase NADP-binding domain-containing protein [Kofleriaceae bacterium]
MRTHDLVLFGATGYTGRLVAERIAHSGEKVKWALAGRDRTKLEHVRADLAAQVPECAELPILVGDALDPKAMDAIAAQAKVVCTTVGPYARYGSELVAACAKNGTDYCDLTGEVPWIRAMIDAHHETAVKSRARIVHCCGFDSIPSDLGVLLLQEEMKRRHGRAADRVTALFGESKGKFSGGTFASLLGVVDEAARDPHTRKIVMNPYALDPDPSHEGADGRDEAGIGYEKSMKMFTAPFVMSAINTRVVRRSHALMGYPWNGFSYRERMSFPGSPRGLAMAGGVTALLGGFLLATRVPAIRSRIEKKLPAPGEGPTAEERARGYFVVRVIGERGADRMVVKVSDRADPGYGSTSKMLSQAALCLALDDLPTPGGV